MKNREDFLLELEEKFDNSSWEEILLVVNQARDIPQRDGLVENILDYVREHNRITFRQWKVLRYHINYHKNSKTKYKYGK